MKGERELFCIQIIFTQETKQDFILDEIWDLIESVSEGFLLLKRTTVYTKMVNLKL